MWRFTLTQCSAVGLIIRTNQPKIPNRCSCSWYWCKLQTEGNNQTINRGHPEYLAGKAAPVLDRKGNASHLKQSTKLLSCSFKANRSWTCKSVNSGGQTWKAESQCKPDCTMSLRKFSKAGQSNLCNVVVNWGFRKVIGSV